MTKSNKKTKTYKKDKYIQKYLEGVILDSFETFEQNDEETRPDQKR